MREGSEATGVDRESGGLHAKSGKVEDWWTQDSVVGKLWARKEKTAAVIDASFHCNSCTYSYLIVYTTEANFQLSNSNYWPPIFSD